MRYWDYHQAIPFFHSSLKLLCHSSGLVIFLKTFFLMILSRRCLIISFLLFSDFILRGCILIFKKAFSSSLYLSGIYIIPFLTWASNSMVLILSPIFQIDTIKFYFAPPIIIIFASNGNKNIFCYWLLIWHQKKHNQIIKIKNYKSQNIFTDLTHLAVIEMLENQFLLPLNYQYLSRRLITFHI